MATAAATQNIAAISSKFIQDQREAKKTRAQGAQVSSNSNTQGNQLAKPLDTEALYGAGGHVAEQQRKQTDIRVAHNLAKIQEIKNRKLNELPLEIAKLQERPDQKATGDAYATEYQRINEMLDQDLSTEKRKRAMLLQTLLVKGAGDMGDADEKLKKLKRFILDLSVADGVMSISDLEGADGWLWTMVDYSLEFFMVGKLIFNNNQPIFSKKEPSLDLSYPETWVILLKFFVFSIVIIPTVFIIVHAFLLIAGAIYLGLDIFGSAFEWIL